MAITVTEKANIPIVDNPEDLIKELDIIFSKDADGKLVPSKGRNKYNKKSMAYRRQQAEDEENSKKINNKFFGE